MDPISRSMEKRDFTSEAWYSEVAKFLRGEMDEAERHAFVLLLEENAEAMAAVTSLQKLWANTDVLETVSFDVDAAWTKMQPALSAPSRRGNTLWIGRIAASLALLFLISWAAYQVLQPSDIEWEQAATTDSIAFFLLPDKSEVTLFKGAQMSYIKGMPEGNRKLKLKGRAKIKVQKRNQDTLQIETNIAMLKVVERSLEVIAEDSSETRVIAMDAKVEVLHNAEWLTVEAGQVARVEAGTAPEIRQAPENPIALNAWKSNQLHFNQTPLTEVVESVRAYFGVNIVMQVEHPEACRFTARFRKPKEEEVMAVLSESLNLRSQKENGVWYLSGAPCKP